MAAKTWTSRQLAMLTELELIDDAFCDIYSEHPNDSGERALGRAIDRLQQWRRDWGMELP